MKHFSYVFTLLMLSMSPVFAQDLTLSFGNAEITNDGIDDFYEADIFIAGSTDFYVGSGQFYLDYNTSAFGANISANGNIEYSQPAGSILGFSFGLFSPAYKDFVQNDNTSSRVSLSFQQNLALVALETAPVIQVTSTPKVLLHIKMRLTDAFEDPGICFFSDGVFQDQFFTACGGAGIADCTNNPGTQITDDTYDCSAAVLSTAYVYNNAWTPSDPSGASTASSSIEIVSGEAVITSNTIANTIVVRAGADLSINSGVTLEATSGISMESTSTDYSSLISDGTITGTVTYERHVNQTASSGGNDLISPPLTGQSFTGFLANNNNIHSNSDNSLYLFGPFDKTSGSYVTYSNVESATLTSGVGYRAATTDNAALSFEGTVNQGTVNQAVFNAGPSFSEWNLIGNPYPSYLHVQDFLNNTNNMGLMDVTNVGIYGYDGDASDGWVIYNLNTTDASTVIAPGQGFFVAVSVDASIEFTPSMRRHGDSDDFIAGRTTGINEHLRLQMNNSNGNSSSTDFYFNGNSTNGLDLGYDAAVFGNVASSFALYSRLVDNSQDEDFAIQSLPQDIQSNGTLIPLGINANQGEMLTIGIESSNLPANIDVYLLDTQTNETTHLNTTDFSMMPSETLSGIGRFYISFGEQTLGWSDSNLEGLKIYSTNGTIIISGALHEDTQAKLYDMNGRLIRTQMILARTNSNTIDTSILQAGVYILELADTKQRHTQKLIID